MKPCNCETIIADNFMEKSSLIVSSKHRFICRLYLISLKLRLQTYRYVWNPSSIRRYILVRAWSSQAPELKFEIWITFSNARLYDIWHFYCEANQLFNIRYSILWCIRNGGKLDPARRPSLNLKLQAFKLNIQYYLVQRRSDNNE